MGRFEGKQLVKLASTTYRQGRCTILRGDDAWVVMHKGRFVGDADTYVEAEELSHNETGRLNAQKDIDEGYEGGDDGYVRAEEHNQGRLADGTPYDM